MAYRQVDLLINWPNCKLLASPSICRGLTQDHIHHEQGLVWISHDAIQALQCTSNLSVTYGHATQWSPLDHLLHIHWWHCHLLCIILWAPWAYWHGAHACSHDLKLSLAKCWFIFIHLLILGFIILQDSIHVDPWLIKKVYVPSPMSSIGVHQT